MKLLFATNNAKKLEELRALVDGLGLEVVSPGDLGLRLDVVEDGATFRDNAEKKATAFARASGLWSLADDSGLCVDALGGAPGVLSARYAEGSDQTRYEKLLADLSEVPEPRRGAHFACVLCLASPEPRAPVHFEEGRCAGQITRLPAGTSGFGYDPVFFVPEQKRTMAELSPELKNELSHRARAFARMRPRLLALASEGGNGR